MNKLSEVYTDDDFPIEVDIPFHESIGNENDMAKDYQVRMQIMPPPNFIATMGANPVRPN